jgi:UDP-N-acetylmuramyl pentapeptide phosphotransferase/UDP-N-acetylglucosamine-1-phosphate transferase
MQFSIGHFLIVGLASLSASAISLYFLIPFLEKKAFLDVPNSRSSHTKITPRGGGIGALIGVFIGTFTAFLLDIPLPHYTFFVGLLLMAITSFADDRKSLPVIVRLAAHFLAIGMVLYHTGGLQRLPFPSPLNIELGWAGYLITAIWILSVINFFNFLDGIDGFAGSQAMVAGIAYCAVLWGDSTAIVSACIALGALGFLFYNWHPAKIFMGDVGSVSLGFAFATLPFYAHQQIGAEGVVYSTAIFLWFFLADGAFTLIRRTINKEKIWEAHRSHLYQRLNKSGWVHDKVVTLVMVFAIISASVQVYFFKQGWVLNWWSAALGLSLFLGYVAFVFNKEKKAS